MKKLPILLSSISISVFLNAAHACTTVFENDKGPTNVVARTLDLYMNDAPKLVISPRGIARAGGTFTHPVEWRAKYGTVVVTEFNSHAVSDGMNEAGLSAHLLYLTSAVYEERNITIPGLSNALWVQYLLDNFKTVSEALDGMKKIQIVSEVVLGREWPVHLNIEDSTGDAAIIEFEKGKINIYHGQEITTMTNEPAYPIQLKNLGNYKPFGGSLSLPGDTDPLSRFVRASTFLKTLPESTTTLEAIANVVSVIRTATVPFGAINTSGNKTTDAWSTRWISIADLTHKTYYFNSMTTANIVWIQLENLNFKQGAPLLSIDPNDIHLVGEVSQHLKPLIKNP